MVILLMIHNPWGNFQVEAKDLRHGIDVLDEVKDTIISDVSIHVRFLYNEQVFRFIYKFNGMPYKGANQLSPFASLGDR